MAVEEGIEVSEGDVASRIEELLGEVEDKDRMRELLAAPSMRESIADRVRMNRTLDRLVAIATGETVAGATASTDAAETIAPEVE